MHGHSAPIVQPPWIKAGAYHAHRSVPFYLYVLRRLANYRSVVAGGIVVSPPCKQRIGAVQYQLGAAVGQYALGRALARGFQYPQAFDVLLKGWGRYVFFVEQALNLANRWIIVRLRSAQKFFSLIPVSPHFLPSPVNPFSYRRRATFKGGKRAGNPG